MHMSGKSPWAMLASSTTSSATAGGHAKVSGAILIPEPERRRRRRPRQLLPQHTESADSGKLLHDMWAHDARARPVPLRTASYIWLAVPALMTVCDLRHVDWCSADTLSPRPWVDVNVTNHVCIVSAVIGMRTVYVFVCSRCPKMSY
ncbi:hypothetical protein B0H11DRAFT_1932280 [Mycena galericulata]|nr:hypothetical protein B0H11DRAFT_1932280 [Mycena galericulata]